MSEREQYLLFESKRGDCEFLREAGIKPCVIYDPCPEPLPELLRKERRARLTETDTLWLRECGAAWEREPEVQLSLNFCNSGKTVQET